MSSAAAAQIMRQAGSVKNIMTESGKAFSDLWVTRQKLEDLYKRLLLLDLEFALDKKVEQELWNHAFKNQINVLQTQSKDRQNPKKMEAQSSLFLFLETASGFYLQLLQTICSTFKLDLPFRRRSAAFGIMRENTMNYKNIVTPKKSSCLYICCHCLVHLGDIARYRGEMLQAQTYYRHAANLSPNNGQPYNQLAILEASQGDKLSTVFYYVRSLAVRHPFPVAATNLEKFYSKLIKDTRSEFDGPNLTMTDIIVAFLQFQALLHMATGLDRASGLSAKITQGLANHIRSQSVSAAHLTGMVAISVFALHRARCDSNDAGDAVRKSVLSPEEEQCVEIHLRFAGKFLETMLQHTPKEDNKSRDFLTLPAVKVFLDWLCLNKDMLAGREFVHTSIWSDLCKLLNTLQWLLNDNNKASDVARYEDTPLPEDADLRCFQPLEPSYSIYNFNKALNEELSTACERDLRCQRLVGHGKWIAKDLPKLKLVVFQPGKSVRTQFSTQRAPPTGDNHGQPVHKAPQRQNVAMQTIMKKRMELDKGPSNPLAVISEEGRLPQGEQTSQRGSPADSNSSGTPSQGSQKGGGSGRQAGVISLHHKGGAGQKPNLPPRLSAKASGSQGPAVSPRLQKKQYMARGSNAAPSSRNSVQPGKGEDSAGPEPGGNSTGCFGFGGSQEAYPSLSSDNYPALVNQRTHASLIPQDPATPQMAGTSILARPNWGAAFSLDGGVQTPSPLLSVSSAVTSSVDTRSSPSRSPQSPPSMLPFTGAEPQTMRSMDRPISNSGAEPQTMRSMDRPISNSGAEQTGLNFPAPGADFLLSIRSASQFVQQQQQQHQQQQQQQQQQQFPQHYGQQQVSRTLSSQEQQQQQAQHLARNTQGFYQGSGMLPDQNQGIFKESGNPMSSQAQNILAVLGNSTNPGSIISQSGQPVAPGGNLSLRTNPRGANVQPTSNQALNSYPLGGLNMPPPPPPPPTQSSRGGMALMGSDVRTAPVTTGSGLGYQASLGDPSSLRSYPNNPVGFIPPTNIVPSSKAAEMGYPLTAMSGGGVSTGRAVTGGQAASVGSMTPYRGVQNQPQHQQMTQGNPPAKSQPTGLLYQNIPLAGTGVHNTSVAASGVSGGSVQAAGLSGLLLAANVAGHGLHPGQGPSSHKPVYPQYLNAQQHQKGYRGVQHGSGQDSALSASFQGHATGTPKPRLASNMDNQHQQLLKQQQQKQPQAQQLQHQSMIRAVLDPPFLQASGEYTLFSNNSSPAWPTQLVKPSPNVRMKNTASKGPGLQMSGGPMVPTPSYADAGVSMQGMWANSGPSPLERLLEQQRSKRQGDS